MGSDSQRVSRGLTRFNGISAGVSLAVLAGFVFWLVTLALAVVDRRPQLLASFSAFFPGYRISLVGAFVGGFWAALVAFVACTPAAMFYYRGLLKHVGDGAPSTDSDTDSPDDHLGVDVARLQVGRFGLTIGIAAGLTLFLAVALLILTHEEGTPLGPKLGLLRHYLPGFRVSWPGGILGAGYFLVIGGGIAACVAGLYNRLAGGRSSG